MTDYAKTHVVLVSEELDRAEHYLAEVAIDDDEDIEQEPEHHQSEWMMLCQLNPTFQATDDHCNNNISWDAAGKQLPQSLLLSSSKWTSTMRSQSKIMTPSRQVELTL